MFEHLNDVEFKRLPFKLKEWNRSMWNSNKVKELWEPRISQITNNFSTLELESVIHGIRPGALQFIPPRELVDYNIKLSKHNLIAVPVSKEGSSGKSGYTSITSEYKENQPFKYRVIVTSPKLVSEVMDAYNTNDDIRIGKILGYPKCCTQFFNVCWNQLKVFDTTYFSSINGTEGDLYNNLLLRFIGVRPVFHLNCSFNCKHTSNIGKQIHDLALELKQNDTEEWKQEMLSWNVEWSALHGIGELKTALFKISFATDATSEKYVVQKRGITVSTDASRGVTFPYESNTKNKITESKSYKESLKVFSNESLEISTMDNGFNTQEELDNAHIPILNCFNAMNDNINSVIDFGCGNAELLKKIDSITPNMELIGVEISQLIAKKAQFNLTHSQIFNQNLIDYNFEKRLSLSILSPIRLIEEVNQEKRKLFIKNLYENTDYVIFYLYDKYINNFGNTLKMCNALGMYYDVYHTSKTKYTDSVLIKLKQNPYNAY